MLGRRAAIVAVLGLAVALIAPATPAAAADKPLFQVLSPKQEGFAHGRSVAVRVRLARGAKLRRASLNGVGVRRLLRRGGGGVLSARIARTDMRALKRGRNFLHVVAARGRARDRDTVSFTLVRPSRKLVRRFRARYVSRHGLRVALRLARLHAAVLVRLNGRDVSAQFADELSLRRGAELGAGDGLRHGRNVLRVRVTRFDGQIRKFKRVFVVPRRLTLAAAGRDRGARAGETVQLDGGASRPSLRRDGRAAGGLRYGWKVVSAPRGSHPALIGGDAVRPRLRTDLPGRYVLRLATTRASAPAGDHATTAFDTAAVEAKAQPLAAVDTMATVGGAAGIAVAQTRECEGGGQAAAEPPCFYPNKGGEGALQVVVLERETLQPISNTSYADGEISKFAAAMERLIENPGQGVPVYESDKLVLIALRAGTLSDAEELAEGLGNFNIGDESEKPQPLKGLNGTPFSLVAVPGTLEGKAAVNFGATRIRAPDGSLGAPGALVGGLKVVSDQPAAETLELTRAFAWPDAIPYDTRVPADTAPGGDAFELAGEQVPLVPVGLPADQDGFAVFTFDPVNPAGSVRRAAFVTNAGGAGTDTGLDWAQLAAELKDAYEEELGVAIVSNGDIGGFAFEPGAGSFIAAQRQLERLGVNPDVFGRAVAADGTYSMLSAGERPHAANITGQIRAGYSASSAIAEGVAEAGKLHVAAGRLTGVLQRATYGAVFPTEGNPVGTPPEAELLQIAFQDQIPWLLTPAPGATAASCQQVAFAYLTEVLGYNEGLSLWSGADAGACEGIDHSGSGGARRADNLDGDSCATTEAAASGANAANVRIAATTLRAKYLDLSNEVSEATIATAAMPAAGAPFTEADLTCAKNQMIDEVAARAQVESFLGTLAQVQYESQAGEVTELSQAAEAIESAMLAKLKGQLSNSHRATGAFWAGFSFQALGSVAKIVAALSGSGTAVATTAQVIGQVSGLGQGIASVVQATAGNPVELTNEYLLLSAQLHEEEVSVDTQVTGVLTAQQRGAKLTGEMLLSDPGRLAAVNANEKGPWGVSSEELLEAQNAYLFRVRQLAYQDYWPQVYSAARLSFLGLCETGVETSTGSTCWNGSEWNAGKAVSLVSAGGGACGGVHVFKSAAWQGPGGLGQGNEYQPMSTPAPEGQLPPSYLDYLMVKTADLENGWVTLANGAEVAPFFAQPGDSVVEPSQGAGAPGFYAPEFWWQNLDFDKAMRCVDQGQYGEIKISEPGGAFREVEPGNEIWPTPPRPNCVKEAAGDGLRATCTYADGYFQRSSLDLAKLVEGLGGDPSSSGVWIEAFGGAGGAAGGGGGGGGDGGFAETYYASPAGYAAALGSTTLHYYLGSHGYEGTGSGGAATLVTAADVGPGAGPRPCVLAEEGIEAAGNAIAIPQVAGPPGACEGEGQNVVLIAAGGGGGGKESSAGTAGKHGGTGGKAVATTKTAVAAGERGNAAQGSHRAHAGYNGVGGAKSSDGGGRPGADWIGGMGGSAGSGGNALWINNSGFFGGEKYGVGGEDGSGNGGHGGGGGGGFGGGGGGGDGGHSGINDYGGSGGAGGGSYAYKGDSPPSDAPQIVDPPGPDGVLVVVVDGLSGNGVTSAARSCAVGGVKLLRGPTRVSIDYRGLRSGSLYAARCQTARGLVLAAAERPGRRAFAGRGFRCRARAVGRRGRARRWVCVRRRAGYAKLKFTAVPR